MKYCSTCGAPAEDYAVACSNCGTPFQPNVNYQPVVYAKPKIPGRGFGISAMVLGIIGIVYSTYIFFGSVVLSDFGLFDEGLIASALVYSILSILAVSFGAAARQKGYRNGVSMSGLVLGIIGLCFTFLSILVTAA